MRATIEQLEYLIKEMHKAQEKYPEARVYYDWGDSEIRVIYPLPKDFYMLNMPYEDNI